MAAALTPPQQRYATDYGTEVTRFDPLRASYTGATSDMLLQRDLTLKILARQ
jgi:hypothetical protein